MTSNSNVKYFRTVLCCFLTAMTLLSLILIIIGIVKKEKTPKPCRFVDVIVKEKYIVEGDAGFWTSKPDQFVVVSVHVDDKTKTTYTTLTTITIYNSLEIGDELYICSEHNELVYDDICPGE